MYTVISLSGDGEYDKSGFTSKQEALDYIFEYLCDACQQGVKDGGYWVGPGIDPDDWWIIDNSLETSCGAEWALITDEEYADICKSSEDSNLGVSKEYLTRQYKKYKTVT